MAIIRGKYIIHLSGLHTSLNDAPRRGIALMVTAMLVLAIMDALSKWLSTRYPVAQIVAVRFFVFTIFALAIARPRRIAEAFATRQLGWQIARGLALIAEVTVFVLALRALPLADVHAIAGVAPLLVTGLAVLCLGETVNRKQWIAIGAGFAGLLVIIRPGAIGTDVLTLLPLLGAGLWAVYQILTRKVSTDRASVSLFFVALIGFFVSGCVAPFVWVTPDAQGWALLVTLGLLGSLGHYLVIAAFRIASASSLQPYHYTLLVWATLLGALVYGDVPDGWTIVGALIIVLSGIYCLRAHPSRRETTLERRPSDV
ncbi:MAG: DMT family transporter [Gammaproteobacteria bacterium]|nr:DMT family transporter [Gammaproteobacteria bacterium]